MAAEAAGRASSFADQARARAVAARGRGQRPHPPGGAGRGPAPGPRDDAPTGSSPSSSWLSQERAEADRHRAALTERLERDGAELESLSESLPELEANAAAAAGRLATADEARRRLEERRSHVAVLRRDLEVKVAGLVGTARRVERPARRTPSAGWPATSTRASRPGERRRRLEAGALATDRLGATVRRARRAPGGAARRSALAAQPPTRRRAGRRGAARVAAQAARRGRRPTGRDPPALAATRAPDGRGQGAARHRGRGAAARARAASPKRPWAHRAPSYPRARTLPGAPRSSSRSWRRSVRSTRSPWRSSARSRSGTGSSRSRSRTCAGPGASCTR